MFAGLVARWPKAISAIPGSKGRWGNAYAAGDRGNGQQLLVHAPIVS
jgi:hypothetical protein